MTLAHGIVSFLLAMHAAGHACLALKPGALPGVTVLLVLATVIGLRAPIPVADPGRGGRQAGLWGTYGAIVISMFAFAAGGHATSVSVAVGTLVGCQVVFQAVPGLGRGYLPLLVNAQALVALASLVGGALAVSALAGHAILLVVWLAVDHRVRRHAPLAGAVRSAVPPALLLLGWFTAAFAIAPPRPNARLIEGASASVRALDTGAVVGAWVELLVAAGVGLALILLVKKLLKKDEEGAPPPDSPEQRPPRRQPARSRSRLPAEPVDLSGARGRVVRSYLRMLRRLARRGVALDPSDTPAELAMKLPAPAPELACLFGRARYSREPVNEDDARRARSAARAVLRALRR